MKFLKLNTAAEQHSLSQTTETFQRLYDEASTSLRKINRAEIIRFRIGDENDADEIFDRVLIDIAGMAGVRNFGQTFDKALKFARYNFYRTEKRRNSRYQLKVNSGNEEDIDLEVADEQTVEQIIEFKQRKKEADQRQLIDFLTDPDQVDHDTTLIVSQFSQYDSITALAKALGMHHEFVKRKLRKLARRYDANRFGDISEYLAV